MYPFQISLLMLIHKPVQKSFGNMACDSLTIHEDYDMANIGSIQPQSPPPAATDVPPAPANTPGKVD